MNAPTVGVVNLECLMSRATILFTSGYRFRGRLDVEKLHQSFRAVVDRIEKFEHRLDFAAQDDFRWTPAGAYDKRFHVAAADDIDAAFAELCRDSLGLLDAGGHCPMVLTVLTDRRGGDEFIVAQTSEHTYVDARSAEVIFNRIVDHYNALCRGALEGLEPILAAVDRLRTINAKEMVALLAAAAYDHARNVEGLDAYPVADVGEYVIPLAEVPGCLQRYKLQRFAPVVRFFDIGALVRRCRDKHPEVTRNSAICAALVKGFAELNRLAKGRGEPHLISFKMLSDLLSPELRQDYSGNYIAFVPVSVDSDLAVEDMAKAIHERIREFKGQKIDLTAFELTEQAVDAALVGTTDAPLSFVVTNWNNYQFLSTPDYLHGCTPLRHQSGVNIDPKDTLGAVLVNRPILVINESPNDELCLSFFPSLRDEAETRAVAEAIGAVISAA